MTSCRVGPTDRILRGVDAGAGVLDRDRRDGQAALGVVLDEEAVGRLVDGEVPRLRAAVVDQGEPAG
jgi:hypothetical protein